MKVVAAIAIVVLVTSIGRAQTPTGSSTGTPAAALASGNATRGQTLYVAHQCFACHGYNGETGTRLLQEDGTFIARLLTARGFIAFLRAPRPNDAPPLGSSTTMPSYGVASLPDQDAADVFAYIKTFKPTAPAVQDIPLLSQMIKEGRKPKK